MQFMFKLSIALTYTFWFCSKALIIFFRVGKWVSLIILNHVSRHVSEIQNNKINFMQMMWQLKLILECSYYITVLFAWNIFFMFKQECTFKFVVIENICTNTWILWKIRKNKEMNCLLRNFCIYYNDIC